MALPRLVPPLEYLRQASLQSFELSRLNHAANLRREIAALIDQWIQESSEAMLARWMLDQRDSIHESLLPSPDLFSSPELLPSFRDPDSSPSPSAQPIPTDILPSPPRFADSHHPLNTPLMSKPQKRRSTA
jgi:hypothetical protein